MKWVINKIRNSKDKCDLPPLPVRYGFLYLASMMASNNVTRNITETTVTCSRMLTLSDAARGPVTHIYSQSHILFHIRQAYYVLTTGHTLNACDAVQPVPCVALSHSTHRTYPHLPQQPKHTTLIGWNDRPERGSTWIFNDSGHENGWKCGWVRVDDVTH